MSMESALKDQVVEVIKERFGFHIDLNHKEWEEAKRDTLNDLYANKLCLNGNVTSDYFINTIVNILMIMKRTTNAA